MTKSVPFKVDQFEGFATSRGIKLTIVVNDMDYCVDVPGGGGNRISLPIKKKYADNAEEFVQAILLKASELNREQDFDD